MKKDSKTTNIKKKNKEFKSLIPHLIIISIYGRGATIPQSSFSSHPGAVLRAQTQFRHYCD